MRELLDAMMAQLDGVGPGTGLRTICGRSCDSSGEPDQDMGSIRGASSLAATVRVDQKCARQARMAISHVLSIYPQGSCRNHTGHVRHLRLTAALLGKQASRKSAARIGMIVPWRLGAVAHAARGL